MAAAVLVAAALAILAAGPLVALAATWLYTHASGAAEAGVLKPGVLEHHETMKTVIYFAALHGTVLVLGLAALAFTPGSDGLALLMPPSGGTAAYLLPTGNLVVGGALWLWLLWHVAPDAVAAEVGDYPRLVRSGWGVLMAPTLCLVAPLAEEVLFRGLLFVRLAATPLGAPGAAVLSSLAWAGLHVDHSWLSQAHLVVAGLLLCWLVERTRSLRVALWCHVLFNTLLTILLILAVPV
jgi:membrane protease YdiL (CAAX protease family)